MQPEADDRRQTRSTAQRRLVAGSHFLLFANLVQFAAQPMQERALRPQIVQQGLGSFEICFGETGLANQGTKTLFDLGFSQHSDLPEKVDRVNLAACILDADHGLSSAVSAGRRTVSCRWEKIRQ